MNDLFKSQDSRFALKTAGLVTLVPLLMVALVIYSVWLLLAMNFSYFLSNGIPLNEENIDVFTDYLMQTQIEYLPYAGLFFVCVFFIGLFLSYIILRPFNELKEMCSELINSKDEKIRIVGLERSKLLIKLGNFLCKYYHAKKNGTPISIPDDLRTVARPTMDLIFYFQFFCLIFILMTVALISIYVFADQLHASIVQTAIQVLKSPKGMSTFLSSQRPIFDMLTIVPGILGCILYVAIARIIIRRVEGATFGYVRDICEVANGNTLKRLSPRQEDPGRRAAAAINEVLDNLHPRPVPKVETEEDEAIKLANCPI